MSSDVSRDELMAAVLRAVRKESSQAALFSQAVAERWAWPEPTWSAWRFSRKRHASPSGGSPRLDRSDDRLGDADGRSTGADRATCERVPDPTDRRRVLVEPVPGLDAKFGAIHAPIARAQVEVIERYDDDDLRLLADFLDRSREIALAETARMRAPSEAADAGGSYAAPIGGVTSGRLVFLSGAPRITVRGDPSLRELYRARFAGPVPRMRVRGGVVTVSYPRFGWFDWRAQIAGQNIEAAAHWRKDAGEIALNGAIPWAIELRGGVSQWSADLRLVKLASFDLRGGANKVEMLLGSPEGVVPIRIAGGLSRVSIERPAAAAMGLTIHGGVNEVLVDGEPYKSMGHLSLQSPGADQAADRYEIEVGGGANKIQIVAR